MMSLLEEFMIEILAMLMGGRQMPARQVFRSIVSQSARIRVMKVLLEEAPHNRDKAAEHDEVITRFERISEARNRYVHGMWYTRFGAIYIEERRTPEDFTARKKREVKLSELETLTHEMADLARLITKIVYPPKTKSAPSNRNAS
nr:G10 protein [uncultured bacterium]